MKNFTLKTACAHDVNIRGALVPLGALYGWYKGRAWYIKKFPETKEQHVTIYIENNDEIFRKAYFKDFRRLYGNVYDYITRNKLYGTKTVPNWGLKGSFQDYYPYDKKHKTTGLRDANKHWEQRGDGKGSLINGNLFYDPIYDKQAIVMD